MRHLILWAAGWLLNRCPPSWAPYAPRVVVVAAYRQLNRQLLEGLEG